MQSPEAGTVLVCPRLHNVGELLNDGEPSLGRESG